MRIQSGFLSILFKTVVLCCLFLTLFSGCKNKTKKAFPDKPVPAWQKLKISTINNLSYELTNPGIDYSDNASSSQDIESFGIRIGKGDETTTLLWDEMKHIDLSVAKNKLIKAKITFTDNRTAEEDLLPVLKGAISGTCNAKECKFRLNEVKAIEVLHAN
jgi:hypothetical protein